MKTDLNIESHKTTTSKQSFSSVDIVGDSVDELVKKGLEHILAHGYRISSRAGDGLQVYGVNYILDNPRNRLHTLRDKSLRYLSRELLAYFKGSLKAKDGLSQASSFWDTLVDDEGCINSNYGHYIFYEKLENSSEKNQYEWVINRLLENQDSRRALININQSYHKSETLDFPCTVGIQFYTRENTLFCEVSARSSDIITGLPYDIGFFTFLHELVYQDLVDRGLTDLIIGQTVIRSSFAQVYDKTFKKSVQIQSNEIKELFMPKIENAKSLLEDIYQGTLKTDIMKWIIENAEVDFLQ